jgi:CBS domain-containing protein
MREMKVRDVMTSPAVTAMPETPFAGIVATLLDHDISGVPVVDDQHRLVGIVTEADLITRQAYGYRRRRALGLLADHLHGRSAHWVRKAGALTAGELMTPNPDVVGPDDQIAHAAQRMLEGRHKRLVVVSDGAVVGVLSRHDLLRPFARSDAEIMTDVRRVLADPFRIAEDQAAQPSITAGVVTIDGTVRRASEVAIVETEIAGIPGVVAVDNRLHAREHEPAASPLRHW